MVMKQTQTKLFDFADVGLDFCSGSKSLFPDRFKKMLSQGYNEQTVASVSVTGNQVTLNYGMAHGYSENRVLKVESGPLASVNGGEFWVNSVTTNTVTFTLDEAPVYIGGGFATKIASLGWELVYEQDHIHIYKFKHIDDTDMYARLCFQDVMTAGQRNCIAIGIGRTVNLATGVITDLNCMEDLAACATVAGATSNLRWDFTSSTASTFNNYNYAQGFSTFGKGMVVGSLYHMISLFTQTTSDVFGAIVGILPFFSTYEVLNYPVVLGMNNGASTTAASAGLAVTQAYIGKTRCTFSPTETSFPLSFNIASSNYLPENIDNFNTTTCQPIPVYTHTEKQALGYVCGGLYQAHYKSGSSSMPFYGKSNSPSLASDIDLENIVARHYFTNNTSTYVAWLVAPVEEVKFV